MYYESMTEAEVRYDHDYVGDSDGTELPCKQKIPPSIITT